MLSKLLDSSRQNRFGHENAENERFHCGCKPLAQAERRVIGQMLSKLAGRQILIWTK